MKIKERGSFRKDLKKCHKRGKEIDKLKNIIKLLVSEKELQENYKDHPLKGNWKGYRDCHIESDWDLIYRKTGSVLELIRTRTHSDLF